MDKSILVASSRTLPALQTELRKVEAIHGEVRELGHAEEGRRWTVALVDTARRPTQPITLVLAPNGSAETPAGSTLVCVGVVYVEDVLKPVAAFREETAGAAKDSRPTTASPRSARRWQSTDEADRPGLMPTTRSRSIPGRTKGGEVRGSSWSMSGSAASSAGRAIGRKPFTIQNRPAAVAAKKDSRGAARNTKPPSRRDKSTSATVKGSKAKAARTTLPALEPREYRVWFGTNRKPLDAVDVAKGFSAERDTTVHYGHCDVYVPRSHKMGSIGKFNLIRWITGNDDRLKIRRLAELAGDDFWAGIRGQIERAAPDARHAVVFIHGYRVSFTDAALRAAQIGFDLGVQGAMGFFSWPSKGKFRSYTADERALEGSEAAVANFLVDFARRSGAEQIHVIAHSMGNRGLLRAANRIVADAARRSECCFGQFILAAADVDADNFRDLADAYKALAKRTTLYVSSKDLAVQLSRWLGDYARVGFHPPVTVVDGIDTVSVANVDLTLLGHGYVAEARPVLQDIERLISTNQPPPRFGQEEVKTPDGRRYWNVRA